MNKYSNEAKERWGNTAAYREFEKRDHIDPRQIGEGLEAIFAEFAALRQSGYAAGSKEAGALVEKLQQYITDSCYTCTDEILSGLGQMYTADERFKENIDKSGAGTAEYVSTAIKEKLQ